MKITIKSYHAVASWRWNIKPKGASAAAEADESMKADSDEEEDVCGICQVAFEGCCPTCKVPGDDCPLIFGECTHVVSQYKPGETMAS